MLKILIGLMLFLPCLNAEEYVPSQWYLKSGIGINYITLPQDSEDVIEAERGLFGNVTAGYQFQKNLHSEMEFSYRKNEGYNVVRNKIEFPITGAIHTYAGLLNIILDFPFQDKFVFSIGAGTGIQSTYGRLRCTGPRTPLIKDFTEVNTSQQTVSNLPNFKYKKEGQAFQGILRVMIKFTPRFGVCGEYKYLCMQSSIIHSTVAANLKLDF